MRTSCASGREATFVSGRKQYGDEDAAGFRDRLRSEMTREQVTQAQRLSREWREEIEQRARQAAAARARGG